MGKKILHRSLQLDDKNIRTFIQMKDPKNMQKPTHKLKIMKWENAAKME